MIFPENFRDSLRLRDSMQKFIKDPSPQGRIRFFRELKQADFLVPCRETRMNVAVLQTPESERLLPAFTCKAEFQKGEQHWQEATVMKLDMLKHILIDQPETIHGIVLDPFGSALVFHRPQLEEIDWTADTMTLRRTDYDRPQILSPLRSWPRGLEAALKALLFPAFARAVEPFMKPGESFELMLADDRLRKEVMAKAAPVYQRKMS